MGFLNVLLRSVYVHVTSMGNAPSFFHDPFGWLNFHLNVSLRIDMLFV